jgi:hypothetical protein
VKFGEFEAHARRVFEEIPEVYRTGVDGLTVRREAPQHPEMPGVYTLGECLTEEHLSDYGSADTTRSMIALYWGSFRSVAREDPDFDWEEEIWETLTHELRHHLESLAGDDALEDVDYAADETFKRFEGGRFDPWYYQYGEEEEEWVFRVERAWYVEVPLSGAEVDRSKTVTFAWEGGRYRIPRPDPLGDVHFVLLRGEPFEDDERTVELVLVRRAGWWQAVKRLFDASRARVAESEVRPEALPGVGGGGGDGS